MADHDEVMRSGAGAEAGRIPMEGPGYAELTGPPTEAWELPEDPFDISQWVPWQHVPSCPCFRCEDFRANNGLTCMYGLGPRPEEPPGHNWEGQAMFAGWSIPNFGYPQVGSADSGGETKH